MDLAKCKLNKLDYSFDEKNFARFVETETESLFLSFIFFYFYWYFIFIL